MTGLARVLAEYGAEYAIMGSAPATLFELSWYLRGMMQVLEDLVTNKDFMHAYLDRLSPGWTLPGRAWSSWAST